MVTRRRVAGDSGTRCARGATGIASQRVRVTCRRGRWPDIPHHGVHPGRTSSLLDASAGWRRQGLHEGWRAGWRQAWRRRTTNVLHRDLKPANDDRRAGRVRLAPDFSLAGGEAPSRRLAGHQPGAELTGRSASDMQSRHHGSASCSAQGCSPGKPAFAGAPHPATSRVSTAKQHRRGYFARLVSEIDRSPDRIIQRCPREGSRRAPSSALRSLRRCRATRWRPRWPQAKPIRAGDGGSFRWAQRVEGRRTRRPSWPRWSGGAAGGLAER